MTLKRRPLLLEFGPYGPSLRGTSGFSVPLSMGRFSTYPYHLDPCTEAQRQKEMMRRRARLQELAREWGNGCPGQTDKKEKPEKAARLPGQPESAPTRVK